MECKAILVVLLLLPAALWAQDDDSLKTEQVQVQTENESIPLPNWGIKTNLLYDATATFNLGVEVRTGDKTSFDLPFSYNPWTFSNNRKWKHILIQPEFRYWLKETFRGHFFGLHGHYAFYNISGLPHPPFSEYMNTHRFEGWLAGAGISYGYRWNFSYRWALEATVGAGYSYLAYDEFPCVHCGAQIGSETKHSFGPTKAGINLIFNIGDKRPKLQPDPVYIPPVMPVPQEAAPVLDSILSALIPYEPKLMAGFITPEAEAVKVRSESGSAFLDFAVGRSEIVPGFRNNTAELQHIDDMIREVVDNPDITITDMTIIGHASPEGTYATNRTLSERRAQALKEHIKSVYGLQENVFTVSGAGEDWAMFDTLVSRSDISEKHQLLEIIRGPDAFDRRESKLAEVAGGAPYRRVKAELFPRLRRSEYRISYTVAPFTVEKGKEVLRTHPESLSLNEMFMIANTYKPGSDAFNEVFETAVGLFPTSDVAQINAAASALGRKDPVSAARYLDNVKEQNVAWWNNSGVLAWMQGDKQKAAECFAKGGEQGAANAAELEKYFQSVNK